MFAWSHTTYAEWKGIIFNFEDKWDRDYFIAHMYGAVPISARDVYRDYDWELFIQVFSSRCLGANKDRARRIKKWKQEG